MNPMERELPPCPPLDDDARTPMMIVNELSRLFGAWMRTNSGETTGVMSQNSARLILRELAHRDGISQLELVRATALKPPTVSVTLKKMEAEGLVRREVNENDQRAVRVFLTEKGRGHDSYVRENLHRADCLVMQNISEEDREQVKKVLLKMRNNILNDLGPDAGFRDFPPCGHRKETSSRS